MDKVGEVFEPVTYFLYQLGQFLPKLGLAVLILLVGWLIAKLFRGVVMRALKYANFGELTHKAGVDKFLKQGGIKKNTSQILGLLVYWLVMLATLLVASEVVQLDAVSALFNSITLFIPKVIVAVLILAIGFYFARVISEIIIAYGKNIGMKDAEIIGRVAEWAIMAFVIIIALGQMDIGNTILVPAFLILFGGVVFALSLAFGLGGQKWAASQFEKLSRKDRRS
ncbi:MAG: hypothetical protein R3188_01895 [Acidiferrobacterales bacterium]|nr:hypothetical protein [Acidiferrobacterales bacterium]